MKVMAHKWIDNRIRRKMYCHKCGTQLVNEEVSRVVQPGDADYREASRMGFHGHAIGAVEITEYQLKCPHCDEFVDVDQQFVMEKIQKKLYKHILTEEDISKNIDEAKAEVERKRKITNIIVKVVFGVLVAVSFLLGLKYGLSLDFYL